MPILSLVTNSSLGKLAKVNRFCRLNLTELGDGSYVANGSRINNAKIGKFCSIGPDTRIGLGKHPVKDFVSTHPAFYSPRNAAGFSFSNRNKFVETERVIIGNDVWLGQSAIVCDGVRIGDGACIAAGAVVTRDVAPYTIVGGVPAQFIRYRFPENVITRLLEIRWWERDIEWIKSHWETFSDIDEFINLFESSGES